MSAPDGAFFAADGADVVAGHAVGFAGDGGDGGSDDAAGCDEECEAEGEGEECAGGVVWHDLPRCGRRSVEIQRSVKGRYWAARIQGSSLQLPGVPS